MLQLLSPAETFYNFARELFSSLSFSYDGRNDLYSLRKAPDFYAKSQAAVFRPILFRGVAKHTPGGLSIPSVMSFFDGVWFDFSDVI